MKKPIPYLTSKCDLHVKKILSDKTRKKMLVYPVFGLLFLASMYLIFQPTSNDTNKQEINGFNSELPVAEAKELNDNKITAYEKQIFENKQDEKKKTLEDFTFSLSEEQKEPTRTELKKQESSPVNAVESYKKINRELSTLYQSPTRDVEKEREQEDNLKDQVTQPDQYAIMEESYKLAAKYLNPTQAQQPPSVPVQNDQPAKNERVTVEPDNEKVVTRLGDVPDSAFIRSFSKKRNFGFNTVSTKESFCQTNTIRACMNNDHVLIFDKGNTQTVTLRLLENVRINDMHIPRNTLIIAEAKLEAERLQLTVKSIQNGGVNIPVSLEALDLNGQKGIYIPSSIENSSSKETIGNLSGNMGTSINLGGNAGQQLFADVSREAIQGVSQYLGKKIKLVKVTIKSNHKVLLINE